MTNAGSWARSVTPGIDRVTFKTRCQDKGGTYTAYRHGNVNCDLSNGDVATCNFIIPTCVYRGPKNANLHTRQFLSDGGQ